MWKKGGLRSIETRISFEDFDSVDTYLDAVIYEARREYSKAKDGGIKSD